MLRAGVISVLLAAVTTTNLQAYLQGQAYERLFQDHLMPGTCGIVLERARCSSDLQTVQSFRGADPTDQFMQQWIATGDIALWKDDWNGMHVPDDSWSKDPAFAWWYTAGIGSIAARLPENSTTSEYAASIASVLAKHNDSAPAEVAASHQIKSNGFPSLKALQSLLAQTVPVTPFPAPVFGSGNPADARLGVYLSTLQELIDNPFALSRPESRAFALIVLNRLKQRQADYGQTISLSRIEYYLTGDIPLDRQIIDREIRIPLGNAGPDMHWPDGPRKAYELGYFTAQVAYNAAVLKDPAADKQFRGWIAALPMFDSMPPDAIAAVKKLVALPPGDWPDINNAATTATLAIALP